MCEQERDKDDVGCVCGTVSLSLSLDRILFYCLLVRRKTKRICEYVNVWVSFYVRMLLCTVCLCVLCDRLCVCVSVDVCVCVLCVCLIVCFVCVCAHACALIYACAC